MQLRRKLLWNNPLQRQKTRGGWTPCLMWSSLIRARNFLATKLSTELENSFMLRHAVHWKECCRLLDWRLQTILFLKLKKTFAKKHPKDCLALWYQLSCMSICWPVRQRTFTWILTSALSRGPETREAELDAFQNRKFPVQRCSWMSLIFYSRGDIC